MSQKQEVPAAIKEQKYGRADYAKAQSQGDKDDLLIEVGLFTNRIPRDLAIALTDSILWQ
jgi:hypothetical protein